jgi:hypothetical protein
MCTNIVGWKEDLIKKGNDHNKTIKEIGTITDNAVQF